ncbi:hypothetical protein E2I00_008828, partial [Balaenoptera physalus]
KTETRESRLGRRPCRAPQEDRGVPAIAVIASSWVTFSLVPLSMSWRQHLPGAPGSPDQLQACVPLSPSLLDSVSNLSTRPPRVCPKVPEKQSANLQPDQEMEEEEAKLNEDHRSSPHLRGSRAGCPLNPPPRAKESSAIRAQAAHRGRRRASPDSSLSQNAGGGGGTGTVARGQEGGWLYGPQGTFYFTSHSPGEHIICLESNSTRLVSFGGSKLVSLCLRVLVDEQRQHYSGRIHLDIRVGEHDLDAAIAQAKDKVNEVSFKLEHLIEQMEQIVKVQNYQRDREEEFRMTSEDTNSNVLWWAFAQTLIFISVGIFQIKYLKDFFIAKKLV